MIEVTELVHKLRFAKQVEEAARNDRLAVEEEITALFKDQAPNEGAIKLDGMSITYKLNRKVDTDKLFDVYDSLTPNAKKAFRFKAEVDLKSYRALEDMDSEAFSTITGFVTTSPAKPSIILKD